MKTLERIKLDQTRITNEHQGSICEISGAGVGFWGIRLRRLRLRINDPAALLDAIYSQGRDFSSWGQNRGDPASNRTPTNTQLLQYEPRACAVDTQAYSASSHAVPMTDADAQ